MAKAKATEADTIEAADDGDDWDRDHKEWRKECEGRIKAQIADPIGWQRREAEKALAACRARIANCNADLRVHRLELKAAEALLASLPTPAANPAPALKAAAKATGRKHVE